LKLILDNTAVDTLRKSYARRSINYDLNEVQLKMARIPMGSNPIQNPVGNAPAVLIDNAQTKIVCLPGVPKEMEAIFLESVLPQIKKTIGDFYIAEISYEVIGVSEAMLAPVLSNIVESNPPDSIYLKTHPQGYSGDNKSRLCIQIVSKGKDKSEVETRYNIIFSMLAEEIQRLGGKII
jgi:molybdopterin-biosynthesis enzyme MoeA-like protein